MTHVTCKLTAKHRDQLRNPTLGNQVLATFFYMEFPLGYTNWVIPISVPFPNTLSETINCKCKQSTVKQQKNSSTENWTSSVEKIKNIIHNASKNRQNHFRSYPSKCYVSYSGIAQRCTNISSADKRRPVKIFSYTYGDSGVISMPAGFRRHLVGKTLINVFSR